MRLLIVLSALAFAACSNEQVKRHIDSEHTRLSCEFAAKDTNSTKDCICAEVDQDGDTASIGLFRLDSLEQPLHRMGWHTLSSDTGRVRVYYTALEDTTNGSFSLSPDQVIYITLQGDTLFEQSTWIDVEAPDTVRLGSAFKARFKYQSPDTIHSFYVGTLVQRADEQNNVKNVKQQRYETGHFDWFTFEQVQQDTGAFNMYAVIYGFIDLPNTETMSVKTSYLDVPFVVVR